MKRIIMMVLRNIWRVPFLWIRLCYHAAHADKYTLKEHFRFLKHIVKYANKGGNVIIESHGTENIPKEDGYIFFPNHQGMYDALAIIDACDSTFGVVAKKEVENVPLLKQVFACTQSYMMDREDIRQSMGVILNVANDVKNGKNFLIFPEGTRSKKGNVTGEFKGGSFKAAMKAKSPIVPVALIDSFKPFDTNSIRPVTVQVHFLSPICYEEYKDMKTTEIADIVRKRIQTKIDQTLSGKSLDQQKTL